MNSNHAVQLTTTIDSLEGATRISEAVVKQKLAACAQIDGPVASYYFWEGEYCKGNEWRVVMKTMKSLEESLMKLVCSLHPYETPELISIQIDNVSQAYLEWINNTLRE